jgi:hypothetical protein
MSLCEWSSPEKSAFENDPINKAAGAPENGYETEYYKPVEIEYNDKQANEIIQAARQYYPQAPWAKEEYWANSNAQDKFLKMLENYHNFWILPVEEQRSELEKLWKFPDSGFDFDRFANENRFFFPDRYNLYEATIIEVPQTPFIPPPSLPENHPEPAPIEEPAKEEAAAPREEESRESLNKTESNKTESKEEDDDLSWLESAKEKWNDWTSSIKDYTEDKKKDFKKRFGIYNDTFYNQTGKDLTEDQYEDYISKDKSFWEKAKGGLKNIGEKIANFTHIGDAKDKIVSLFKGKNDTSDNETESEEKSGDLRHDREDSRREEREDKEDLHRDRDFDKDKDKDIDKDERREDKEDLRSEDAIRREKEDSEDRAEFRSDSKNDREDYRREKPDIKDNRSDMKFLEDKERH